MNIANMVSASRIVLSPLFFCLYFMPSLFFLSPKVATLVLVPLFAIMQFTDFLDGYLARKLHIVSDFGKLFDPFSDVLANMAILFCFTLDGYLPPLFFLIVLYREFSIMFVRTLAMKKGVVIGAKMLGKIKTVLYICVGGVCLAMRLASFYAPRFLTFLNATKIVLYCLAAFFSILSFLFYLKEYRRSL